MDKATKVMMNLIGSEVCGKEFNSELYISLTEEEKVGLYRLSKKHDLAHIVGNALINRDLLNEEKLKSAYQNEVFTAVYRYESIDYELKELRRVFNEAQIPFIPLKGSVIRKYYPEPWMRTSCDIDILVHKDDLERAIEVLVQKKGYQTDGKKNFHDVSMYSSSGIHLELHFNIKETVDKIDIVLENAWEYAEKKYDSEFEYEFLNEFLLFHLYAHASYHFIVGGCGARTFIDLYLLTHKIDYDRVKLKALLEKAKIEKFADEMNNLAETWFCEREYTELSKMIEVYILQGGVYGTLENRIAMSHMGKGKFGYALSRIWLPYKTLKIRYPSLEKHKWLLPIYEIRRWFALLFNGGVKRGANEIKVNQSLSEEKKLAAKNLIDELGL